MSLTPAAPATGWAATQGRILTIAWPVMLSNITVPLLGLVDSAILGHLPDAAYLGAVSIGAQLFTLLCWSFGFLRMGTTALTARSRSATEQVDVLGHAFWLAIPLSAIIGLCGWLLLPLVIPWMGATPAVSDGAQLYLSIRVISVPAVFAQYALLGWFIGRGQTRVPLIIMTITNLANGGLDALFVYGMDMTTDGVALGSVMADYIGLATGLWFVLRQTNSADQPLLLRAKQYWLQRPSWQQLQPMIRINHQLFVRTLTLLLLFAFFNAQGARQGELILAANSLIITLLMLISNALDGIAHAAESLTGQTLAQASASQTTHKSPPPNQSQQDQSANVRRIILITGVNSVLLAVLLSLLFAAAGSWLWPLLTDNTALLPLLDEYQIWLVGLPLAGFWSYWLDGLCIGAGATHTMRNAMLAAALLVFMPLWWLTTDLGNTGLWLSFYAFLLARAVFVTRFAIQLYRQPVSFAPAH
ncbi:MATE family efflux transporter [Oceanobacter sp. 4_MG-2023]|uniref:MATE family efflux transporter n=1 Tax=Oceanobacter sp. 4_MG-2023 TaxID=3062623 RepID=UPI002734FF5C|nr:MATE family efflux transporter [Oceanobacter sp. 4_MG-2023]MDP2546878.1 MATE family efflux transporter [Oceanobacter sp. 4_MG-2023]